VQRRERILMLAVGVLAGGWLLDGAVLGPAMSWYDGVRNAAQQASEEAAQSQALVDRQSRIMADWRSRHAAGLLDDEATARFRMQSALAEAARSGGIVLDNVSGGQLIPAARDETCDTLRLTASGQGSLTQVMGFLHSLESSAQPLRIERSELSSGDARKDQIELSLTVSTRLVPAKARAGRGVPEGTVAWTPEPADAARGEAVVAAKPFLAERRGGTRAVAATTVSTTIAAPATPGGWALVGIVNRNSGAVAFLRHLGNGSEQTLAPGDEIDGRTASAVDSDGIVLGSGAEAQRITVGTSLDGTAIPATGGQRPAVRTPPASSQQPAAGTPAASTPAATTPLSDPGREAILERLRQQRNRTP
jgi:hypothetical protein